MMCLNQFDLLKQHGDADDEKDPKETKSNVQGDEKQRSKKRKLDSENPVEQPLKKQKMNVQK